MFVYTMLNCELSMTYKNYIECIFGRNPRALDTLETTDCSCKNYNVQFKLIQIATEENYFYSAVSSNRRDPVLSPRTRQKYKRFIQSLYTEDVVIDIDIGGDVFRWNSLDELLNGNAMNPNYFEFIETATETFIGTTSNFVVTDCEVDYNGKETVTVDGLITYYSRPEDPGLTDVIQRYIATYIFTRCPSDSNTYFLSAGLFKTDLISLQNARTRTGTDATFNTFDH